MTHITISHNEISCLRDSRGHERPWKRALQKQIGYEGNLVWEKEVPCDIVNIGMMTLGSPLGDMSADTELPMFQIVPRWGEEE